MAINNKNKNSIYLIIGLFFFTKNIEAQLFLGRLLYQEKTSDITIPYDTAFFFNKVNVFSFVDYRIVTNKELMYNILSNSSFNNIRINDTSNYIRYPVNTSLLKTYCEFEISKFFNHYMGSGLKKPLLINSDSLVIVNELAFLKKQVKDSLIKEIKMSDKLFSIFSKYPADLEIVTDILMYHSYYSTSKKLNNCALLRVFVFDLRLKKIIIYNYKTSYGGINYKLYDPNQNLNPTESFKKLIHSLKPYMKANKSYLKKIKQNGSNQFNVD